MRAALLGLALAAALVAAPARLAAADGLPPGMIGVVGGIRSGTNAVQSQFRIGALWGIEAGWQPMSPTSRFGYAVRWRALFSGFWSAAPSNPASTLRVVEMDVAPSLRIAPRPGQPRFLDVGGGLSLLRSNVPLAPDMKRAYWGPFVSVGLEQFIGSTMSVTFEIRVGELFIGPTTASAIVGFKVGM
jgi:hypothetical protein